MRALRRGDSVAVVAPSSPFDRARFERGVQALASLGLEPRYDEDLFAREGHLAGTDARREAELRAALESDAKAIVLARGGYGALRFATRLTRIADKPLVGYSDATVLHEVWWRAGVRSIHGPMCTQLGEDASALARLGALLFGDAPGDVEWEARGEGTADGVLRGGNLASLASLCGTPLQPRFDGAIVLLEDLNEPPYRLDRLLTQLLLSGAFEGARGFVIGDLVGCGEDPAGREDVVRERLSGWPVQFGAPFGHAGRNQPVLLGAPHRLAPGRLSML